MIHQAIKSTISDNSFWEILATKSIAQAGPFDGGCLICAKALQLSLEGAELVRITSTANEEQTEHYGIRLDGVIYDMAGMAETEAEWLEGFKASEGVRDRELLFSTGYDSASDIPDDPWASKEISKIITKHLVA